MSKRIQDCINRYPTAHSLICANRGNITFQYQVEEANELVDVRSITKTIVATLIGILHGRNQITSLRGLLRLYVENAPEEITIEDLLCMKSGLHLPDGKMSELAGNSQDWTADILGLPIHRYGEFRYFGLEYHLLSALISKVTNKSAFEFAKESLFKPLGIEHAIWGSDPAGITFGSTGLKLTSEGLVKIGQLYLHNGQWLGRQLFDKDWVTLSTKAYMRTGMPYGDYGFGWWITELNQLECYRALGAGGQQIFVSPQLELVVVITSHSKEHSHQITEQITKEIVDFLIGGRE